MQGRRRLRDQRHEDLVVQRAQGELVLPPRPDRPGRAEAQGHHLLRDADGRARHQPSARWSTWPTSTSSTRSSSTTCASRPVPRRRGEPRLVHRHDDAGLRALEHLVGGALPALAGARWSAYVKEAEARTANGLGEGPQSTCVRRWLTWRSRTRSGATFRTASPRCRSAARSRTTSRARRRSTTPSTARSWRGWG